MYFQFWYLITWNFTVLYNCNPVPTPATAVLGMFPFADPQRRITDFWTPQYDSRKGEGYCGTIPTVGAEDWISDFCKSSAKHGQPPLMSNRSSRPTGPHTAVNKRSFKRACRRALCHGHSHYHGQRMTPADFPQGLVSRLQQEIPVPRRRAPSKPTFPGKARITCMHWNPGGLSQSTWLEVRHWLQRHPVDLVVISETRWSFSSHWHDKAWIYVHSATQEHKSGGLLLMVSSNCSA